MSEQEIFEKVKAVVAQHLVIEKELITPEANFVKDLGADSLDRVELIMALENAFNVEISDEKAEEIVTVQQVSYYVTQALLKV